MAVCGGNCMGFANLERRVRALGFYEPKDAPVGGVTFLSHSGSAFSAMIHNDRALGLNLAVSAGQEFVTTVADYLTYALGLESTKAVGLFIETVRDPDGFREALAIANERDVPVVALKVGREERTRELVAAHSGALAGEDGAYEALFDAYGVSRVESLDEMGDTLALFAAGRRAGPGGLASVHDSGGERALMVDAAAQVGVPFGEISDETSARMEALLDPGLPPVNPLDFWGTGRDAHEIVTGCVRALLEDPEVAALAFAVDLTSEEYPDMGYIAMARETFPETDKPYAMLSNFSSGIDRGDAKLLDGDGIPVLEGTLTGLAAFKHLFAYRDARARPPVGGGSPVTDEVRSRWIRAALERGALRRARGARAARRLRRAGRRERSRRDARGRDRGGRAARVPGRGQDGGAGGAAQVRRRRGAARRRRLALARGRVRRISNAGSVRRSRSPRWRSAGVEIALGIVRDPQFGPLVLVGAGGVLVEVLKDRRLAMPPLDELRARSMVDRLKVRPLLDGVRGQPASNVDALAKAVVAFSWLAHDLGDHLEALDANPVICGPDGCVAVDALVIPRSDLVGRAARDVEVAPALLVREPARDPSLGDLDRVLAGDRIAR